MDEPRAPEPDGRLRSLSRRSLLAGLGATGFGALIAACTNTASSRASSPPDSGKSGSTTTSTTTTRPSTTTTVAPGTATPVQCVLTPEQTEGPYYIDADLVRRDITEGRPGTPMLLSLVVANATTCVPIPNAIVDVWHCDASGNYSGFDGSGARTSTRYLRGVQPTNASGVAELQTIYPGWYRGRTVHVHVKVHVGGREVHTGQLYFPEDVTGAVYQSAPYSTRPGRDTMNATDSVYRDGGAQSILTLRKDGTGYVASIVMGVRAAGGVNPL